MFLESSALVYGVRDVVVRLSEPGCAIFWMTMVPLPAAAAEGYPDERLSIAVWSNTRIIAVPHDAADRTWKHRQSSILGELCLYDPADPRPLRWEWEDGLAAYVMIVYKHLLSEEYARRNNGAWPAEDAPHGRGPHPIRSQAMRAAVRRAS